jgi:hypothetical protein
MKYVNQRYIAPFTLSWIWIPALAAVAFPHVKQHACIEM